MNETKNTHREPLTYFGAGALAGLIAFKVFSSTILAPSPQQGTEPEPTWTIIECPVRLADIDGYNIGVDKDGKWELSSDQDILAWLDLPDDIAELRGDVDSTYPYEVKIGETGTISFQVKCFANDTKYVGTTEFVAVDDLTLGAVCNGINLYNSKVEIHNDITRPFSWMEAGKHAYICYPLYTSCAGKYDVYNLVGGASSVGYYVQYTITADGAPAQSHTDVYPGQTARCVKAD